MTDDMPPPRRRRHVAHRARTIAAGLSATAFLGLRGAMAIAAHEASATTARDDDSGSASRSDPWGDAGNSNSWGAQPPNQSFRGGAGSTGGGADTTTHGS
jgi:hypothetical protein